MTRRAGDGPASRARTIAGQLGRRQGRSARQEAVAAMADRNDAEFFDHLTADQRAALEGLLREIVERRGLKAVPTD